MPPSRKFSEPQRSSSMRHLKVRLRVLGRPRVWGSVSLLLVASYGLFQYWSRLGHGVWAEQGVGAEQGVSAGQNDSNALNSARRNPLLGSGSDFSSEFDFSSPSLGNLPASKGLPQPYATPPYATPGVTSTGSKVSGSPTKPNTFNPFTTSPAANSSSVGNALGLPSAASTSPDFSNPSSREPGTVRSINPLQAGLDRNLSPSPLAEPPNGDRPASATVSNPGDSSLVEGSATETMLSPVGAAQFQLYTPRTSPPPGSTGYTLPPAFRTPANSGSDNGFSVSRPQPIPGSLSTQIRPATGASLGGQSGSPSYGAYPSSEQSQVSPTQVPQYQSPQDQSPQYQSPQYQSPQYQSPQYQSPQDQPFSVPRTTPGRSIGGGRINTFSNP